MTRDKVPTFVWITVCAASVIQTLYYYSQLPARIASHFGPSGQADGWSSKQDFLIVYLGILGLIIVLFAVLTHGVSILTVSWINLPNKQYWFAPEHRQETLNFLRHYPLWFASATTLLMMDISHQAFLVNMGSEKSLPHPTLSLAVYIGFSIFWAIGLLLRFRKPTA